MVRDDDRRPSGHQGPERVLNERFALGVDRLALATVGVYGVVATMASYLPARRSMRLAPLDALRTN
jgi:hypothetical protein